MKKHLFFTVLLCIFFAVLAVEKSFASAVSPTIYDYSLDPGQTIRSDFTVFNNDQNPADYYFRIVNIDYLDDTAEPVFDLDESPGEYTLASWIRRLSKDPSMQPMTKEQVYFEISVPEGTPAGTYTAVVFFVNDDTPAAEFNPANVGLGTNVGVLYIVTVQGDNTQIPEFVEFELNEGFNFLGYRIMNLPPATFETRLKNIGNTYFMPQGKVIVRDSGRNNIKSDMDLNPDSHRVLPGKIRLYTNPFLKDQSSYVSYKRDSTIINHLKYAFKNLSIGKYNAELSVDTRVTGDQQIVYSEQINFIIFPYKLITAIILLLILLFVLRKVLKRDRKDKRKKSR